jgi:thioredoxin-dependent peroxiredoxin
MTAIKTMKTLKFLPVLTAFLTFGIMLANAETKLKVGDSAPKIEAKDQDGKTWKLADHLGKKNVLIYFYPKDNTPGCTKESCGLRDRMGDLKKQQVEVVGVSFDDMDSHQKFITQHSLNFPLLADTDGKVADAFGARKEPGKNMAKRISFLINKEGKIVHITDSPSADVHLTEMKDAAEKLGKS